jgi:hypothetical protein
MGECGGGGVKRGCLVPGFIHNGAINCTNIFILLGKIQGLNDMLSRLNNAALSEHTKPRILDI